MALYYSGAAILTLWASIASALPGHVRLNNGVRMPLVSLGTAEYNNSGLKQAIAAAVDAGFTGLDTAFNYYNQESVGQAVKQIGRDQFFLTTKTTPCFHPQALPRYNISDVEACRVQTRKDVESDFAQLGVDKVDLLLLHGANHFGQGGCDEHACALNQAQWRVYEEFHLAGKARAVGVSNFCASCLACTLRGARVLPAVNQIKYHVGMTADPEGLISYSRSLGIVPMAYTPLGSGELFQDPLLAALGARRGKTAAQVALHWIVAKGIPLATASSSPVHLAEDMDLFSWALNSTETASLDAYSRGSDRPSWACTVSSAGGTLLV